MRTADRLVARDFHFPLGIDDHRAFVDWCATEVQTRPVLVADNVARYLDERGTPDLTDLPSLAPPWPAFWIEYPSTSGRQRRGVLVADSTDAGSLDHHFWMLNETATRNPLREGDAKWTVSFVLFVEVDGRKVWGPLGISSLTLDEHGGVLGHAWSVAPMLDVGDKVRQLLDAPEDDITVRAWSPLSHSELKQLTPEQIEAVKAEAEARQQELVDQIRRIDKRLTDLNDAKTTIYGAVAVTGGADPDEAWLTRALAPAYQAVAFLHCKNVVLDETVPAGKVQARRRRRGKEPLVRYHTLRLDVPRKSTAGESSNGDKAPKSLHIVAGHFAHYGACCANHEPHGRLFGRLEGVYWVPTHARGNRDIGTIRTDFDLRVPA